LQEEQSLQDVAKEPAKLDVAAKGRIAGTQVGQEKAAKETK
jgi:hypothetical protein